MRCMRPYPEKTALILDFVSNVTAHGLPDADIKWTLDGKAKNQPNEIKIKTCSKCYAVIPQNTLILSILRNGFLNRSQGTLEAERVAAELREVQAAELERLKNMPYSEVKKATTWEEVIEIQKAKKYKIIWAVRYAKNAGIAIPSKYMGLLKYIKE